MNNIPPPQEVPTRRADEKVERPPFPSLSAGATALIGLLVSITVVASIVLISGEDAAETPASPTTTVHTDDTTGGCG